MCKLIMELNNSSRKIDKEKLTEMREREMLINSCWTLKVVVGDVCDLKKLQDKKNIE